MVALNNHYGLQGIKPLNFRGAENTSAPNYPNLAPLDKDTFVKSNGITNIKERKSPNGMRVVAEFDSKTGRCIKSTSYQKDGKTLDMIDEFDLQTGNRVKNTWFYDDGNSVRSIHEYNPSKSEFSTRDIKFKEDGKTVEWIDEYDQITGAQTRIIWFDDDGKTISRIDELSPSNEHITVKSTCFKEDGKTVDRVINFDPQTGEEIKTSG
jgi:hypothetical protein